MKTINDVHLQFASLFKEPIIEPYAELISRRLSEGHTCINIEEELPELPLQEHQRRLQTIPHLVATTPQQIAPFILQNKLLYLHRYYKYEVDTCQRLYEFIQYENQSDQATGKSRRQQRQEFLSSNQSLVEQLFPIPDGQKEAALLAFQNNFTLITGGPGTGKTTTVAKMLTLLFEAYPNLKVALAAPTGKAAIRMVDSLRAAGSKTKSQIKEKFDALKPQTIHSLLKYIPRSIHFKYNQHNPLPYDLIIIDESSMADIALFSKLLNAIPTNCRLILLGDRNQLSSVEAGSVFGDLCQAFPAPSQHSAELLTSHRFSAEKGIGKFSVAVLSGNTNSVQQFYTNPDPQVNVVETLDEAYFEQFIQGYAHYINEPDISVALQKINALRILCATREGAFGVHELNKRIEIHLRKKQLIDPQREFYHNRPILITTNNYDIQLFNGDIGIVRETPDGIRCYFEDPRQGIKAVFPGYIPSAETVYAMTIHKSQGSEYNNVLTLLPDNPEMPILSRELLYTAVTRAKDHATVVCSKATMKAVLTRHVQRSSGIIQRIQTAFN